jgi:hypothetical protein
MPRVALRDSLRLSKISGCLYTPYVQDKKFLTSSSTNPGHRNFNYDIIDDIFIRRVFQDLAGYPRILNIVDLRPP